jgi:hypothetical protein
MAVSPIVYTLCMTPRNHINPAFLTDLSNPNNVYLLGRIWADGHLNLKQGRTVLQAVKVDAEHMLPFVNQMGVHTIYSKQAYSKGKPFGRESTVIQVTSRRLTDWLQTLDYEDKSRASPSKVLALIPPTLRPLFWRGFLDGDGSLYLGKDRIHGAHKLAFWGTQYQDWTDLTRMIEATGARWMKIEYERRGGKHCSSTIQVRQLLDMKMVCDWIYESFARDGIGLPRKHEMYQSLLVRVERMPRKASQHRGISYDKAKPRRRWFAMIPKTPKGTGFWFHARFETEEEAYAARKAKMKELGMSDVSRVPTETKVYRSG